MWKYFAGAAASQRVGLLWEPGVAAMQGKTGGRRSLRSLSKSFGMELRAWLVDHQWTKLMKMNEIVLHFIALHWKELKSHLLQKSENFRVPFTRARVKLT